VAAPSIHTRVPVGMCDTCDLFGVGDSYMAKDEPAHSRNNHCILLRTPRMASVIALAGQPQAGMGQARGPPKTEETSNRDCGGGERGEKSEQQKQKAPSLARGKRT